MSTINVTNKFRLDKYFNAGKHENGRKKQITDGIKERKEPKFASGLRKSQKLCPGGWDLTSQKEFSRGCPRGGSEQLEFLRHKTQNKREISKNEIS